jgi:hypothetical protein
MDLKERKLWFLAERNGGKNPRALVDLRLIKIPNTKQALELSV